MKIIEPKVELWQQGNDSKAHVARCARVCYGRETGNDEHWSMFRHGTYYMIANDSDLRYYGTTSTPHPNAKLIAGMIRNNLMELGYDFRD